MTRALVAFPEIDATDRRWIESFRADHDPAAARIALHFTLVFPHEVVPGVDAEIAVVARSTEPIEFVVRRTEVVADVFGNGHHVFLVPDEGADRISALHDKLYAGSLRAHLRSNTPFVPHMTIAAVPDRASALTLASMVDSRGTTIRGTLRAVDLLDAGAARVTCIARFQLAGKAGR